MIALHKIPYVTNLPDDGQTKIIWIKNGELLEGASTNHGHDGVLNATGVQIQENVEVLEVNIKNVANSLNETNATVEKLEELAAALEQAFGYDEEILVERFIQGRELTVAFLEGFGALPVIEIRPHSGAYDYKSKYTAGMTEYLVPAPISEELTQKIQAIACKVANGFHCRGISRLDIMLGDDSTPYVLEINTIPGMTETSLVPQAAAALNISYEELCEKILQSARHDG